MSPWKKNQKSSCKRSSQILKVSNSYSNIGEEFPINFRITEGYFKQRYSLLGVFLEDDEETNQLVGA